MNFLIERVDAWLIALGFAASMFAAWGLGWRHERARPAEPGEDPGIKFTDASMALLGLLLGFTFSMSLGRHEQRRSMVVTDSNAIGDFYTCASLLKEPTRTKLQGVIKEYAQARLFWPGGDLSESQLESALQRFQGMHARMTDLVADAVTSGTPIAVSLTNTLNGVTSNNASRLAAYRDRLHWSVVTLLFLGSVVPAYLMGRQQGAASKVRLRGILSFIFLVTVVIDVSLDLNQPGRGLITVSQEPMERLVKSMTP